MKNLKKTFGFILAMSILLINFSSVLANNDAIKVTEGNIAIIPVKVKVKNNANSTQQFKFKISSKTTNAPQPTVDTLTINGNGSGNFTIPLNKYESHQYTIEQIVANDITHNFDKSVYTVFVSLSNESGKDQVTVSAIKGFDGNQDNIVADKKVEIIYENEYIKPTPPYPNPDPDPKPDPYDPYDPYPYDQTPGPSPEPSPVDPTPAPKIPTNPSWTITLNDGTKIQHNGDIIRPDGTRITQDRAIYNTSGIKFEVTVATSGVKFVKNRAPGEVTYGKYVDNTTGMKYNLMTDTVTGVKYIVNVDASGIKFENNVLPFKMELADGTRIMPDGEVKFTDGTKVSMDNSVTLDDGTYIDPERNVTLPSGESLEIADIGATVINDNVVMEKTLSVDPVYSPTIRTSGAISTIDEPNINANGLAIISSVSILFILLLLYRRKKEEETYN